MIFLCEANNEICEDQRGSSKTAKPSSGVMGASVLSLHFPRLVFQTQGGGKVLLSNGSLLVV